MCTGALLPSWKGSRRQTGPAQCAAAWLVFWWLAIGCLHAHQLFTPTSSCCCRKAAQDAAIKEHSERLESLRQMAAQLASRQVR